MGLLVMGDRVWQNHERRNATSPVPLTALEDTMPRSAKSKQQNQEAGITLKLDLHYPPDAHNIQFLSVIRFSQAGTDVIMDVGVLDQQKLIEILTSKKRDKASTIAAHIRNRFGMSINTFAQLKKNVDELWNKMKAQKKLLAAELR